MSPKLPVVSGHQLVRVLESIGYEIVRQRGSHIRLRDESDPEHRPVTVPDHRTLKPGLLRQILRDANLTVDELVELLGR
ncbi:MAG: type II toxin-antitoxin system HicA family toxin [Anaerolineae bacterium]|nr:type II toxin-antitoxin system HicA family toxin [Anaerolineae bacterium]